MAMLRLWLMVGLMAMANLVLAQEVSPFVKGSFAEIQQQYEGQPYLVLFWGQDCAYCMKELAALAPILSANPGVTLVTVATDPFLDETFIREKMVEFGLSQADNWVFADEYPEILYFDVEKRWRGELPLTFLSNGKTLIRKSGLLKEADISAWLASIKQN
jgi:thiol-disulfide isomerase/thioredoxin